jgi:hypothetical protein
VPGILRLFSVWLIVMLPVVLGSQAVYLLLVDDWSFGLKNVHTVSALTSLGVLILLLQHLYRVFTIVVLLAKRKFGVANARVYLLVSVVILVTFMIFVQDSWMFLVPALAVTLTWWIVLLASKKVRAYEKGDSVWRQRTK